MREFDRRFPLDPDVAGRLAAVIRTGEPSSDAGHPRRSSSQRSRSDDEHLEILREVGFTSALRRAADRARADARRHRAGDRRASPGAAWRRRRCRWRGRWPTAARSRSTTRWPTTSARSWRCRCRRSCCRATCRRSPGLDVAARYAAAGQGNEVGGDFYDVFAVRRRLARRDRRRRRQGPGGGRGHRPRAAHAARGRRVRALAERAARSGSTARCSPRSPAGGWRRSRACGSSPAATALRLTVSVGGHPLPLVVRADGTVREIGTLRAAARRRRRSRCSTTSRRARARRPARALHRRRRPTRAARRALRRGAPARAARRLRGRRALARRPADRVGGARRVGRAPARRPGDRRAAPARPAPDEVPSRGPARERSEPADEVARRIALGDRRRQPLRGFLVWDDASPGRSWSPKLLRPDRVDDERRAGAASARRPRRLRRARASGAAARVRRERRGRLAPRSSSISRGRRYAR